MNKIIMKNILDIISSCDLDTLVFTIKKNKIIIVLPKEEDKYRAINAGKTKEDVEEEQEVEEEEVDEEEVEQEDVEQEQDEEEQEENPDEFYEALKQIEEREKRELEIAIKTVEVEKNNNSDLKVLKILLDGSNTVCNVEIKRKYIMLVFERINNIDYYLFDIKPTLKKVVINKLIDHLIPESIKIKHIPLLKTLKTTCHLLGLEPYASYLDEYLDDTIDEDFLGRLQKIKNDPCINLQMI